MFWEKPGNSQLIAQTIGAIPEKLPGALAGTPLGGKWTWPGVMFANSYSVKYPVTTKARPRY